MIRSGAQIRAARALLGWTRADLAVADGLHQNSVARQVKGPSEGGNPGANSGETAPAWPRGRPFRKGQSGNPSGRPRRDHDIGQLARSHTAAAVETLVLIMRSPSTPASSRVMAASALLDRGWGKAPRSIALDQKDSFSDQFEAFIRELQSKGSAGLLPKRTPIS